MSKNRRRRWQTPKGGANRALSNAMQGKRFSNAAGIHKGQGEYNRKDKHKNRRDWS